ncbi:MAG: macro domain-containing protein, partial [Clostridia bacterium]|nr:macro domain-containing protein [Clostridia bacterium]
MPFQIIRNDITKVKADAIVNTANPKPAIGSGTDSAIYKAAGKTRLLAERKKLGDIAPGAAAYTRAFRLNAKYIIHTVGPAWDGGEHGEREILRSCYANSLALAAELECGSIAFPLIATGVYGFPKDEALRIALDEINRFLLSHDMNVILVVLDRGSFELSARLSGDIQEYVDNHSAAALCDAEYGDNISEFRRKLDALRPEEPDEELFDDDAELA